MSYSLGSFLEFDELEIALQRIMVSFNVDYQEALQFRRESLTNELTEKKQLVFDMRSNLTELVRADCHVMPLLDKMMSEISFVSLHIKNEKKAIDYMKRSLSNLKNAPAWKMARIELVEKLDKMMGIEYIDQSVLFRSVQGLYLKPHDQKLALKGAIKMVEEEIAILSHALGRISLFHLKHSIKSHLSKSTHGNTFTSMAAPAV